MCIFYSLFQFHYRRGIRLLLCHLMQEFHGVNQCWSYASRKDYYRFKGKNKLSINLTDCPLLHHVCWELEEKAPVSHGVGGGAEDDGWPLLCQY